MAQTVRSEIISTGHKKIILEKPLASRRIFFGIKELAPIEAWCESWISFGDPMFYSYYIMAGHSKYFEAKGEGIFQGDVWVFNNSGGDVRYTVSEILV